MTDVYTMNLSDSNDGMVNLNNNQSTNFIPNVPPPQPPNIMPEKNTNFVRNIYNIWSVKNQKCGPEKIQNVVRIFSEIWSG